MMKLAIFIVECLLFGFFLWLGLYIFTRDIPLRKSNEPQWLRPALLCGLGIFLFSGFILVDPNETDGLYEFDPETGQLTQILKLPGAHLLRASESN